jgi:hypothetical protein
MNISMAAEAIHATAMAAALQPAWSSASGASTPTTPKTSAGMVMSQSPPSTC